MRPDPSSEAGGGGGGLAAGGGGLAAALEALLFSHGAPLKPAKLAEALEVGKATVGEAAGELEARLDARRSGLMLVRIAGGLQLTTREEWREPIERLLAPRKEEALTQAALEALSVIAYRQPLTLPELNDIRGVNSQSVVTTLLRQRLIRTRGRKRVVGRPLLYGTTKGFLERFGLDRIEDLPRLGELGDPAAGGLAPPSPSAEAG